VVDLRREQLITIGMLTCDAEHGWLGARCPEVVKRGLAITIAVVLCMMPSCSDSHVDSTRAPMGGESLGIGGADSGDDVFPPIGSRYADPPVARVRNDGLQEIVTRFNDGSATTVISPMDNQWEVVLNYDKHGTLRRREHHVPGEKLVYEEIWSANGRLLGRGPSIRNETEAGVYEHAFGVWLVNDEERMLPTAKPGKTK